MFPVWQGRGWNSQLKFCCLFSVWFMIKESQLQLKQTHTTTTVLWYLLHCCCAVEYVTYYSWVLLFNLPFYFSFLPMPLACTVMRQVSSSAISCSCNLWWQLEPSEGDDEPGVDSFVALKVFLPPHTLGELSGVEYFPSQTLLIFLQWFYSIFSLLGSCWKY